MTEIWDSLISKHLQIVRELKLFKTLFQKLSLQYFWLVKLRSVWKVDKPIQRQISNTSCFEKKKLLCVGDQRYHKASQHLAAQMGNEWMRCKLDISIRKDGLFPSKDWVMDGVPKLVQMDSAESALTNRKENPLSRRQSRRFSKLKRAVSQATCEHSCKTALLTDVLKIVLAGPIEMECTYGTNCNQTLLVQCGLITNFALTL